MLQYIVLFEGVAYGPFLTNDETVNAANTDAEYWASHNCFGASIMELKPPASFLPPFPASEAKG
jgi:hypothetical protein